MNGAGARKRAHREPWKRQAHLQTYGEGGSFWRSFLCFWTPPFGHEFVRGEEEYRCVGCDIKADELSSTRRTK
jgi:hypothetical protein